MRILIIEDDAALSHGLSFHLRRAGFEADTCGDGLSGLAEALRGEHDLILLDRMLPGLDGARLLTRLREKRVATPVLMITAMTGVDDRVEGLDAGADDYLVKPFAMEELLARVRALGRRPARLSPPDCLTFGHLSLDEDRGFLRREGGASCSLSKREARLLAQFMRNPDQTLPRDLLLSRVWGSAPVESGNLDNYVYFLRKRLKTVGADCAIITVHGLGFRLERA